jgi:hypothetical protein
MRVRVMLRETGWVDGQPGPGSFESVEMTIYGDLYDGG